MPALAHAACLSQPGAGCPAALPAQTTLLSGFGSLLDSPAGLSVLNANLRTEQSIYLNATPARRVVAAEDALLNLVSQNVLIAAFPPNPVFYYAPPGQPIEGNPTVPGLDPGNPALDSPNWALVINAASAAEDNADVADLKTAFGIDNSYGVAYGSAADPGGDPRPFQVSQAIFNNPYTPANASTFAYEVQQTIDDAGVGPGQNWQSYVASPAFPSGHATDGNIYAIVYAVLAPGYYQGFVNSGVQFGLSRNIFGVHYPLDVIGGRILATYTVAQTLAGSPSYATTALSAATIGATGAAFQQQLASYGFTAGGMSPYAAACAGNVAACIASGSVIPTAASYQQALANYTALLTYGLPATGPTNLPPIVPANADLLIATRFPYLNAAQLDQVLASTELPSGSPFDLPASSPYAGWDRLNLYAAAGGYGAFTGPVTVTMNAAAGGFSAFDVWSNNISGPGSLTLDGSGTLILAGDDSYSGGTNVDGGTLAATGSLAGNLTIAPGATFVSNGAYAVAANASLSNSGTYIAVNAPLINAGSATNTGVILGNLTNSGSLINAGTLAGGLVNTGLAENAGLVAGPVANTGILINSGTVTGAVSGTGTIAGAGSYLGGLSIGGTIMPGGGGPGTASAAAAGSANLGSIAAAGPVVFLPGSTYAAELGAPGQSSHILTIANASLTGGTVAVNLGPGFVPGFGAYPILGAAGGVTGRFAGVTDPFGPNLYPFLGTALAYSPSGVDVVVGKGASLATAGQTPNEVASGTAANALPLASEAAQALSLLSDTTAPAALAGLSGDIYASDRTVLQEQSIYLRQAVAARLQQSMAPAGLTTGPMTAAAGSGSTITLWQQGLGATGTTGGDGNAASVSRTLAGYIIGADAPLAHQSRIGFAAGFDQNNFNTDGGASTAQGTEALVTAYGGTRVGRLSVSLGAGYTWNDLTVNRTVAFPGFAQSLQAAVNGGTAQTFAEADYDVPAGRGLVQPFAQLAYVAATTAAFAEGAGTGTNGGTAAALSGSAETQADGYATLGLRGALPFAIGGVQLAVNGLLGWQHVLGGTTPGTSLALSGTPFAVSGVPIARDEAVVGTGLAVRVSPRTSLSIRYSGQYGDGAEDSAITGNLAILF